MEALTHHNQQYSRKYKHDSNSKSERKQFTKDQLMMKAICFSLTPSSIRPTQAAMTPIAAFRHDAVNNSHTYNLLANPDSGLQLQSDTYILNDLLRELSFQ